MQPSNACPTAVKHEARQSPQSTQQVVASMMLLLLLLLLLLMLSR